MWNDIIYSRTTANLYLRLLCRFEPEGVLNFLKGNDSYDIDECLQHCHAHMIHTASAYLLERKGDLKGAFDGYTREICRINDEMCKNVWSEMPSHLTDQANEACTLAISLCVRSCEGRRENVLREKEEVVGSLWYQLTLTYVEAFQNAKVCVNEKHMKSLLEYLEKVVGRAAPYLHPQLMAICIIENFQDTHLGELREVVQVLMHVSDFELQTSKLTQHITNQECLESMWNSYSRLTKSEQCE